MEQSIDGNPFGKGNRMNNLTRLTAVGLVLIAITLLFVMLSGRDAHSEETRYNFVNILSVGNDVAFDTLDGAARIIIAPSKDFWQRADKQRGLFHRGVVTGVYEDYVSIRVVDEHGVDPLMPQGQARLVHLPAYAIARITTFTDAKY